MQRRAIYKTIERLTFDVDRYVANRYQEALKYQEIMKLITTEQLKSIMPLMDGFRSMAITDDDAIIMGMNNRFPKTLQRHYDICFSTKSLPSDDRDDEISVPRSSGAERDRRWALDTWTCSCGAHQTLWHKTHLRYKDRYQIYCASCQKLAGWGTKKEYDAVVKAGEGEALIITHPLDRDRYKPAPMLAPKPSTTSSQYTASRNQSVVRAKRTQSG